MRTIITYGTFDLFHVGHLNLLERLADMGERLVVGVSSDEFNRVKGKHSFFSYEERSRIVSALACVDEVFPEHSWDQKRQDIQHHQAEVLGMGSDWEGKFDHLGEFCEIVYLTRTESVSSTGLRQALAFLDADLVEKLKTSLDGILDLNKSIK